MGADPASRAVARLDELRAISDDPACLTRTFLSPAMREASTLVRHWMKKAGLEVHEDAVGNLIGRLAAPDPKAPVLICGSHLDTVRNAGRFDGALGVVAALAAVEQLQAEGFHPRYHLDLIGFSDEEGVRYQTTYLGSRRFAEGFPPELLATRDADGISLAEALDAFKPLNPHPPYPENTRFLGYVEAHIEQGPVLEELGLAVGAVDSICGQTRASVTFEGLAQHAGTTTMNLRKDALAAAAEFVLLVEKAAREHDGTVATVGELHIQNAASNTVPGHVSCSLDLRSPSDSLRHTVLDDLSAALEQIRKERNVDTNLLVVQEEPGVTCSPRLGSIMEKAIAKHQNHVPRLHSGAGHDAVMMAHAMHVTMLFVRCRGGLSHHPDEFTAPQDIATAVRVLAEFLAHINLQIE